MYRKVLIVGVRQIPRAHEGTTVAQVMEYLGRNTGNMMFTEGLTRSVEGAEWCDFSLPPEQVADCDAVVLAAANWVNSYDDFGWLADRLEAIDRPVFVVGLGVQASSQHEYPKLKDGTLRLLHLIRERSNAIGARGEFSCEVLSSFGIKTARPVGCPSLLLIGPQGPKDSLLEAQFHACSVHSTRHGFQATSPFQAYLFRQAMTRSLDLILQSETADMYYALQSQTHEPVPPEAREAVGRAYSVPDPGAAEAYLLRHGRTFVNYDEWISYMKTRSFCFGTRIHGTIASLIAGVPATLIAHDSRTAELAKTMAIPMVQESSISQSEDVNIATLFSRERAIAFQANYASYYAAFRAFFAENGLAIRNDHPPRPH